MFIAILLSFLITTLLISFNNCQTQYRQRQIQSPIKDLRYSFWSKQLTAPDAYSEQSQKSKMKLFEKSIFSRRLFQPFTIYRKSSILDFRIRSEYVSGTINYFRKRLHLMLDWALDTSLTCLKKDKNCEKPLKELFLETFQLRLEIISKKFLRKTLPRNDFLHSCFQQVL